MHRFTALLGLLSVGLATACGGAAEGNTVEDEVGGEAIGANQEAISFGTVATSTFQKQYPAVSPIIKGTYRPPIGPIGPIVADPTPNSDLRPEGAMRFYGPAQPTLGLQIDVTNIGTSPAYGPSGRVIIAGSIYSATLYQYYGGTATAANTVNAGERGYLLVRIPPNVLSRCGSYGVQIDVDHNMQNGTNAFANDLRPTLAYETGVTCRLAWTSPLNAATLGTAPTQAMGSKFAAGSSLQDIVSSIQPGRPDGMRCSSCHNSTDVNPYRPPVAKGGVSAPAVDPFQFYGGSQGWACGSDPWAFRFANTAYPKPQYLRDA
ncbi:MAG TPA: hypothetical protein VK524_14590, partial [Polyangiaceae bacterium]|nr:hypothetical protein [Polyangiaceae bacterium]